MMGVLGLIFYYIGISMGWLYEAMGNFIGSAVTPSTRRPYFSSRAVVALELELIHCDCCAVALGIMSRRANKWGCIAGAWAGLILGVMAWLVAAAKLNNGSVTIETTGQDYPMLTGNLTGE